MSAFKPKSMWDSTRKLEQDAYNTGRNARCAELAALRKLEQAVRDCGLPAMMCSGEPFRQVLVHALEEVEKARGE